MLFKSLSCGGQLGLHREFQARQNCVCLINIALKVLCKGNLNHSKILNTAKTVTTCWEGIENSNPLTSREKPTHCSEHVPGTSCSLRTTLNHNDSEASLGYIEEARLTTTTTIIKHNKKFKTFLTDDYWCSHMALKFLSPKTWREQAK